MDHFRSSYSLAYDDIERCSVYQNVQLFIRLPFLTFIIAPFYCLLAYCTLQCTEHSLADNLSDLFMVQFSFQSALE